MVNAPQLDQAYHFIMESFVETGQAPHFTELATSFGISADEGGRLLHELVDTGWMLIPMWFFPDTDLLASFSPFSNLPTQYRITVDGRQKWFAQ